ncbi:MAG: response regulator transcription factor [Cyclobacteriaceae bacterium]|jgi:two-component system copper resistance phosphate regulon response regulator CusR|nr:response regulator transcription factor [Cyclobacteriaceae bacterium]
MNILLVEDEPKLHDFVRKGLQQQGYQVWGATNGSEALELAAAHVFDLILLDVMLPGQTGLEVLDNLKKFNIKTPVIILSALGTTENVIAGLDKGAMDYVKKPFDFGELLARIRAVTRKTGSKTYTHYKIDLVQLDLIARKVWVDGREVNLTKREFHLLELLMVHANRVISKTELAERVWEVNFDMGSNVIEVHMSQLRKKLGMEEFIQTRVGLGYVIEGNLICR